MGITQEIACFHSTHIQGNDTSFPECSAQFTTAPAFSDHMGATETGLFGWEAGAQNLPPIVPAVD